jgi:hypothetical protein
VGYDTPHYIAFGDSFTSGEGELEDRFYQPETNTISNKCHVSTRSYPYLLQSHWEFMATNLACSGSRIDGVQKASHEFGESNVRPPGAVSVSVGGNDADFIGKLKSCLSPGTCEWAQEKYRMAAALEIKNLFPRLVSLIQELKRNYGGSHMFVVGYPNSINAHPEARCSMLIGTLLSRQEREYMSESIRYLNRVIKAAAKYTEVSFTDIEDSYGDERLCDSKATAVNGVRYGDDIAPIPVLEGVKLIGAESFHPTPRGHYLASQAIRSSLTASWESPACNEGCPFEESDLDMPSYWLEGEISEPPPQLLFKDFLNNEVYEGASKAFYEFLKRTFAPHSIVTLELHSEVNELGQIVASKDGSIKGEFELPLNVEGYHTVHAFGTSYSGEPIDIYQTIYIDSSAKNETKGQAAPTQNTTKRSEYGKQVSYPNVVAVSYQENKPVVKGAQVEGAPPHLKNEAQHAKPSSWYSWIGVGLVAGSALYLLWWIFFKKPKP